MLELIGWSCWQADSWLREVNTNCSGRARRREHTRHNMSVKPPGKVYCSTGLIQKELSTLFIIWIFTAFITGATKDLGTCFWQLLAKWPISSHSWPMPGKDLMHLFFGLYFHMQYLFTCVNITCWLLLPIFPTLQAHHPFLLYFKRWKLTHATSHTWLKASTNLPSSAYIISTGDESVCAFF